MGQQAVAFELALGGFEQEAGRSEQYGDLIEQNLLAGLRGRAALSEPAPSPVKLSPEPETETS